MRRRKRHDEIAPQRLDGNASFSAGNSARRTPCPPFQPRNSLVTVACGGPSWREGLPHRGAPSRRRRNTPSLKGLRKKPRRVLDGSRGQVSFTQFERLTPHERREPGHCVGCHTMNDVWRSSRQPKNRRSNRAPAPSMRNRRGPRVVPLRDVPQSVRLACTRELLLEREHARRLRIGVRDSGEPQHGPEMLHVGRPELSACAAYRRGSSSGSGIPSPP